MVFFQNMSNYSLQLSLNVNEVIYLCFENYVVCYIISSLTINTASIGDIAYSSQWYQMPRTERICVQMIIRRSQRACEIKGLGVFVCSLGTYLTVMMIFSTTKKHILHDFSFYWEFQWIFLRFFISISVDSKLNFVLHSVSSFECYLNAN